MVGGEEDEDGDEFEDVEGDDEGEEVVSIDGDETEDNLLLSKVYGRRLRAVPDMSALLKTRAPAATLPFIMVSNLASFLFYSRYYNGNLLDVDPLKLASSLTQ